MYPNFHILVVEDSAAARIVIRTQLGNLGQIVDMASTKEEALDRISSTLYDMILISKNFYYLLDEDVFLKLIPQNKCHPAIGIIGNNFSSGQSIRKYRQFCSPFSKESSLKIINFLVRYGTK
jgi:DNA-binding NtrC family response regulator